MSQLKARNLIKNSEIDFFTSLIKEGKFINVVQGLTIFINKKGDEFARVIGSYDFTDKEFIEWLRKYN